jgi:hypothetical protein
MKKQINLTQSDLYNVIKESVKNVILEYGNTQKVRSKMAKAARRAVKKGDSSVYQNAVNSITKGGGSKKDLEDFQKEYEDKLEESKNLKEYTEFDKMKMYGQDVDYDENFENLEDSENLEEYNDIDLQNIYSRPSYDEDFEDVGFNQQPSNVVTGEGRKPVKVTESQLKAIIRESVKTILKEVGETEEGQKKLGGLAARKSFNGDYNGFSKVEDYAKSKRNGNLKMQDKYAKGFHSEKDRLKDLKKKENNN